MKVSDLTGPALDWAVAKCEGYQDKDYCPHDKRFRDEDNKWFCPSEDWAQGGAIIEREQLSIECIDSERWLCGWSEGATPRTAAMRCYVASKLGDEVEIPAELIGVTNGYGTN